MQQYDAMILAGGRSQWLGEACGTPYRVLATLNGKRFLDYIIDALRNSGRIRRIAVAALPEAVAQLRGTVPDDIILCDAAGDLPATAYAAAEALGSNATAKLLGICDDIPLITGAAIDDFLTQCEAYPEGQLYYPLIPKEAAEKFLPDAKRTYGTVTDGTFTGGNMMLVARDVIPRGQQKAKEIFALRKSPFGLANWLGWSFIARALFRRLSIADAEKRFSTIMEMRSKAIITNYAEIGMDVDKPIDLQQATEKLK